MLFRTKPTKRELAMLVWHVFQYLFAVMFVVTFLFVVWDRYRPR